MNLILLAFAFVCFTISFFRIGLPDWNKLVSAGLALASAAYLFPGLLALHAR